MDDNAVVFEQLLLTINEVFVYRVPPLRSAKGHRAEEWGLDKPALTGSLKVKERGEHCYIEIYDMKKSAEGFEQPELFCSCPIRLNEGKPLYIFFDQVADSSRYFVVRAEDEKTKRGAMLGIGFRDRQYAFDLKAAISDFEGRYNRTQEAEERQLQREYGDPQAGDDDGEPVEQLQDLSLKEGEKITVSWRAAGTTSRRRRRKPQGESSNSTPSGGLLPPPSATHGEPPDDATQAPLLAPPPSTTSPTPLLQPPPNNSVTAVGGKAAPLLAPPPSSASQPPQQQIPVFTEQTQGVATQIIQNQAAEDQESQQTSEKILSNEDDDWGDFVSSG